MIFNKYRYSVKVMALWVDLHPSIQGQILKELSLSSVEDAYFYGVEKQFCKLVEKVSEEINLAVDLVNSHQSMVN